MGLSGSLKLILFFSSLPSSPPPTCSLSPAALSLSLPLSLPLPFFNIIKPKHRCPSKKKPKNLQRNRSFNKNCLRFFFFFFFFFLLQVTIFLLLLCVYFVCPFHPPPPPPISAHLPLSFLVPPITYMTVFFLLRYFFCPIVVPIPPSPLSLPPPPNPNLKALSAVVPFLLALFELLLFYFFVFRYIFFLFVPAWSLIRELFAHHPHPTPPAHTNPPHRIVSVSLSLSHTHIPAQD